jgi:hypothetical protein
LLVVSIFVVAPNPIHREVNVVLVAALWDKVEEIVSPKENVEPARIRGIGVKDLAVLVLVEDAQPRKLIHHKFSLPVIVIGFVPFSRPPLQFL